MQGLTRVATDPRCTWIMHGGRPHGEHGETDFVCCCAHVAPPWVVPPASNCPTKPRTHPPLSCTAGRQRCVTRGCVSCKKMKNGRDMQTSRREAHCASSCAVRFLLS